MRVKNGPLGWNGLIEIILKMIKNKTFFQPKIKMESQARFDLEEKEEKKREKKERRKKEKEKKEKVENSPRYS